ncbi:MAG: hypothetical protein R3299_07415, partial [Arenibacter sp.]|nr:hypothetical protein [Arenibacter sp.]
FEICLKNNVIPIPVGATGYVSKMLWDKVTGSIEDYYPLNKDLQEAISNLDEFTIGNKEIIKNIIIAINILQKN